MKKVNFQSLKSITAPDEWMEKALSVPEIHSRREAAQVFTLKRIVTVAACFVLVCVMSIPVYMFSRVRVEIPAVPTIQTEHSTGEHSGENTSWDNNFPVLVDPTEKATLTTSRSEGQTDPTEQTASSQNTLPTDTSEHPTSTERNTNPTEHATIPPTKPTQTEESTGGWTSVTSVSCSGIFLQDSMSVDGVEIVYCRLYDRFGNLVGDPNIYSSEHIAEETPLPNGYTLVFYDPTEKGVEMYKGTYRFYFYLGDGSVVFEGSVTV